MADLLLENIIDTYLKKGMNSRPGEVDPAMQVPGDHKEEGWSKWLPILSEVTDEEVLEFESRLGHKLPDDYVAFLKYRHFYELNISEASFCSHPVNTWQSSLSEMIFYGYPQEYLLDRGLIPFANWSDWGLLCFDVNRNFFTANYPIVLWDHETADWHTDFCISFRSLIKKLDSDDKKSWEKE